MEAHTIDEVIRILDTIIADCMAQQSRLGYFAALYRKMTTGVKEGIAAGVFDDGKRMEQLDVVFANRYLEAYRLYREGRKPTASWQTAFDAAGTDRLTVLQHLLLGINAHINLDLGIAAAAVSTAETIDALLPDYNRINTIITGLFGTVQESLTRIAFPMYFIRTINPATTSAILNFSIGKARETAWSNALILSGAGDTGQQQVIGLTDNMVSKVAGRIQAPGAWIGLLLRWVRMTEGKNIAENIAFLNSR